jgi:hypothetical protein
MVIIIGNALYSTEPKLVPNCLYMSKYYKNVIGYVREWYLSKWVDALGA